MPALSVEKTRSLTRLIAAGDTAAFRAAITKNPQLAKVRTYNGNTLLQVVVCFRPAESQDRTDMVDVLLKHGAVTDVTDNEDKSLLMLAAERNLVSMCQHLIRHGVNIAHEADDLTALDMAVQKKHFTTSAALIAAGADVNRQNANGSPPLLIAASRGDFEGTMFLIDHGANVKSKTPSGSNALHLAAISGSVELCGALLDFGFDPDQRTFDNKTAEDLATGTTRSAIAAWKAKSKMDSIINAAKLNQTSP